MIFIYTLGGAEGLFIEAGDKPQPGTQVLPWGRNAWMSTC
jgi:hypothetical protein